MFGKNRKAQAAAEAAAELSLTRLQERLGIPAAEEDGAASAMDVEMAVPFAGWLLLLESGEPVGELMTTAVEEPAPAAEIEAWPLAPASPGPSGGEILPQRAGPPNFWA